MCGRYALYGPISRKRPLPPEANSTWYGELIEEINRRKPRYNFAPTQASPVVGVKKEGGIGVHELRWGLVPFWANDTKIGYKAINARAETVADKPMFRAAFKERRCLVPANGYFEWKGDKPPKQPYFIHDLGGELLLFAGLWETWRPEKDAEPLYTYTIVTGPPGLVSGDIHDRAPVILPPSLWESWLTGSVDDAKAILESTPEPELVYHPVPKAVGSPKNDSPDLVELAVVE
jgi:putative SOS response-associated peptidase YedK